MISKVDVIKQIPLFASFSEADRSLIVEKSTVVEFKKDDLIYNEGDAANAFFCIVSGRVLLYTFDSQGKRTVLEYLHRGKYFGIISIITGEPHSVSAQAVNDSIVLKIDVEDFKSIITKIPQLSLDLMKTLSRRIKRKDLHQKIIFESTVISVYSYYASTGKTVYAINLALGLKKETNKNVILIDVAHEAKDRDIFEKLQIKEAPPDIDSSKAPGGLDIKKHVCQSALGIDIASVFYTKENPNNVKDIIAIISLFLNDYHYIIIDLPTDLDKTSFGMLNQSDLVHVISLTDVVDLKRTGRLIKRLEDEHDFDSSKIKVIVNDVKESKLTYKEKVGFLKQDIFATLPNFVYDHPQLLMLKAPDTEYARTVRRISRQLGDCRVGLALGVGAAYGFAHIGVLKVIEEEKIPIDVVSGSSIGSLIAAFWAAGFSAQEIEDICESEFKDKHVIRQFVDLTFPRVGFIKGRKIYKFLKKYLGNMTFYDLRMPLKVIACDVKHKKSNVIDKGNLVDAVLASCAMPGVFRPVSIKEQLLVDGGILNPLPTEILVKESVRRIIAVNVTPSREDILKQVEKAKRGEISVGDKIEKKPGLFGINWNFKDMFRIDILDLIFSSIEVMQSEMAKKESQLADIILHPDTSGLHWLEFYKAEEFVKRGEEEARRHLDKIKLLVNE